MGNGESQPTCYFGADEGPKALRDERASLRAVQDMYGSETERVLLAQLLAEAAAPEDLADNRALCEAVGLACLRFRRHDMATATARFQKYITWRREQFGGLSPQDVNAVAPGDETDAAGGGGGKLNTTRALLDLGVVSVLPRPTPQGQAVMLLRLHRTRPADFVHHARIVCRAAHYRIMAAIERLPSAQTQGLVVVVDFNHTGMANIDRKVPQKMGKLFSGILPVRLAGILVCNPNMLVRVVVPLAKMFLSEKLAARLNVVLDLDTLTTAFGLPKDVLPVEVGGTVVVPGGQDAGPPAAEGVPAAAAVAAE